MAETDLSDLKPARENPWYILMTLHGEQTGDGVDGELAEKNVRLWNIWSCQLLSDAERAELREAGAAVPDADAWETHRAEIEKRFADRIAEVDWNGREIPDLPDPKLWIDMSKTAFSNKVNLEKAVFGQRAFFNSVTFTQAAFFNSATFTQVAFFASATFMQAALFDSATFMQATLFDTATFTQDTSFDSATFTQPATFDSATFTQDASFRSTSFEDRAYFTATRFGDPESTSEEPALLDLTDAQFDKPASFRAAKFINRFPKFTGAIIHERTLFPYLKTSWPKGYPLYSVSNSSIEYKTLMREAANSCAFIRNHIRKLGHPDIEHYFFRREMGFAAQHVEPLERLPILVYGWVSGYGYAVWRLVGFLALLWLAGFVVFQGCGWADRFCVFAPPQIRLMSWQDAAGLSFSNLFRFFGFQVLYFREFLGDESLADSYKVFASAQTVFSFIFLFFLGLGLRQRFRLR